MTQQSEPPSRLVAELTALWHELPAALVRIPVPAHWRREDLLKSSNVLRTAAWREHCAEGSGRSCVNRASYRCLQLNRGTCTADVLVPMSPGGGSESWRMSTLRLSWCPDPREIRLIAIGATAVREIDWASRCLRDAMGWHGEPDPGVCSLGDLALSQNRKWRLRTVSPWVFDKCPADARMLDGEPKGNNALPLSQSVPSQLLPLRSAAADEIGKELCDTLAQSARRITTLCSPDGRWQVVGGELARMLSKEWLPKALTVEVCSVPVIPLKPQDNSNGGRYVPLAFDGSIPISVAAWALPWLTLASVSGLGRHTDKGNGVVEVQPRS